MKNRFLCKDLYDLFEERILTGKLLPGSRLPSNQELADEYRVSIMTANRMFKQLEASGYIRRKQGLGSFVCDTIPRRGSRAYKIGLADNVTYPIVPIKNAALDIRPKTISHYLQDYGCKVEMINYDDVINREVLSDLSRKLDGLIVSAGFLDQHTEKNLSELTIPVIIINGEFPREVPFHQVIMDMTPGLREAAQLVTARDYPEVIIVRERHSNGIARCSNFIRELVKCGFNAGRIRCISVEYFAMQNKEPSFLLGMKLSGELSGKLLFSTSDIISFTMMEAFRKSGIVPGKDFDLLSFDNLEEYGYLPFEKPELTTIDYPRVAVSERAAQLLLEQINHPTAGTTIIRISATLKIRSTAFNGNLQ